MKVEQHARRYHALLRQYGWRRCAYRAWYDVRRRRGWLTTRYPIWAWHERPLSSWLCPGVSADPETFIQTMRSHSSSYLVPPGKLPQLAEAWTRDAIQRADGILSGRFPYFQRLTGTLSFPDTSWFTNPFTGSATDAENHWLSRNDFEPTLGDIKFIWEPSRFLWVYDLVRAHAATNDAAYPEAFWQLVASWRQANRPQMGPNWQCGQEVAIRVLALAFGMQGFWHHGSTTPERVVDLVVMLAASAERIAANIDYARAQMGNHATSEAAALITVGRLFPELAQAAHWLALGQRVLADESTTFHWSDGSYVQHSMNYHRLMLDAYLWAGALGLRQGDPLPDVQLERLDASWQFLYQMQDPYSGRVPNYGPNDGAQILPLHGCGYLDFRPIIDACCMLTRGHGCFEEGPWSEKARWLFDDGRRTGGSPGSAPPRRGQWFSSGGYETFRGRYSWGVVRCHTYRNRPNQADMLHLDLWWRGLNVLRDSGSYTYFDPDQGWERYFVSTAAHNTVRVGGVDQMIKGGRFQWHSLVQSSRHGRRSTGELEVWSGEHRGYRRLPSRVSHGRTIVRCGDASWVVIDDISGYGQERLELFWHLHDAPLALSQDSWLLATSQGPVSFHLAASAPYALASYRGEDARVRAGWESLYYGERTPAPTIITTVTADLPVRFITLIAFTDDLSVDQVTPLSAFRWRCQDTIGALALEAPGVLPCPVLSLDFGADRWHRDSEPIGPQHTKKRMERGL